MPARSLLPLIGCFLTLWAARISAREPNSGIYAIWATASQNSQSFIAGGQVMVNWDDIDTGTGTQAVYNWSKIATKVKDIPAPKLFTIQINGNLKPEWLKNMVPYHDGALGDQESRSYSLMYWHPAYKQAYHDMLEAASTYIRGQAFANRVLGIRMNFNAIGTEATGIPSSANEWSEGWTCPAGVNSYETDSAYWPWTDSKIVGPYKRYIEQAYYDHVTQFVFCRNNDAAGIASSFPDAFEMATRRWGWFWTSDEAQPRTGGGATSVAESFDKYCKTGKTLGYTESYGDAWGEHVGKWDDVLTGGDVHWCSPPQFIYWRMLQDIDMGISYIGVYGDDLRVAISGQYGQSYPAGYAYPKWATGDVSTATGAHDYQSQFKEAIAFGNKYAGYHADGANSPGAFIAFREGVGRKGDYELHLTRVAGNTEWPTYKTLSGSPDIRYGAFARILLTTDPILLKFYTDYGFLSSLALQQARISVIYLDSGTGTLTLNAGGQSFQTPLSNSGDWKTLTGVVSGLSLAAQDYGSDAQIKLSASDSKITLHMVEVERIKSSGSAVKPTQWQAYGQ